MRKITFLVLALSVLRGYTLFAGGQAEEGTGPKNIVIWTDASWGAGTQEGWKQGVAKPFMEQNPGINVEIAQQADVYNTTRTALAGGSGPDLVMTYGPFALELAKSGFLYPLDEYVDTYEWDEHFAPWSLLLYEVEGSTYALPDEIETLVLYYNKTLFSEQGWQVPKTISELVSLGEDIDAAGIIPFAHSNAEWRGTNEWFVGEFINHYAGPEKVYQALKGEISWTDQEFVESQQILTDMLQNDWFMDGLDRYYTTTTDQRRVMFGNGKAAMSIEGTWAIGSFGDYFGENTGNNNDWEWTPMPSKDGTVIYDVGIGNALAMNANTDNPDEVAQLLAFFYSSETQGQLFTGVSGKAPAPVDVSEEDMRGSNTNYVEILLDMNKAFAQNNYGYTTWTFFGPKTNNYIIEEVEKLWAGNITAKEYMQGWQKLHAEEIEAGEVPPIPSR